MKLRPSRVLYICGGAGIGSAVVSAFRAEWRIVLSSLLYVVLAWALAWCMEGNGN